MNGCCIDYPETERQRNIRHWETAKQVFESLRKKGMLNDIPECNTNQIQIELYKNIVCRIKADGDITYGYGVRFYGEKSDLEKKLGIR